MYTCIFSQLTKWLKEGIGVRKTPGYLVIVASSCHYASFHLPLTFFLVVHFPFISPAVVKGVADGGMRAV